MENTINYEKWLELQHYKKRSIETLKSLVLQLQKYLEKEALQLNAESLKSFCYWVANQGYSLTHQNQIQWGIRSYCSYLKLVQNLKINVYLPKLQKEQNRRKALNQNELATIASWLEQEQKDYWLYQSLWTLFYGCGLRRTEVTNISLKDFEIRNKLLHIHGIKGGKKRSISLSSKQINSILQYIEKERPMPKSGFENVLFLGKRGGLLEGVLAKILVKWQDGTGLGNRFCWHVLRHSIATELVQKGMKLEEVSRFLGHRGISSTAIYLHYIKQ